MTYTLTMLKGKHATALWARIAGAPPEWFRSAAGKAIIKRCVKLIRDTDGKTEARTFLYLTWLARVTEGEQGQ